jgi:hypothetical protein
MPHSSAQGWMSFFFPSFFPPLLSVFFVWSLVFFFFFFLIAISIFPVFIFHFIHSKSQQPRRRRHITIRGFWAAFSRLTDFLSPPSYRGSARLLYWGVWFFFLFNGFLWVCHGGLLHSRWSNGFFFFLFLLHSPPHRPWVDCGD